MRIALLAPPRFPIAAPFAGGLELHTHQLLTGLRALGHGVTLFGHPDSTGRVEPVRVRPDATTAGVTPPLYGALRRIAAGRFDVLHDNSIHFLPPLLARTLPLPVVTTLHTPPYRSHRWLGPLGRGAGNHRYVSISQSLARRWAAVTAPGVRVIPNGIAVDEWPFSARGTDRTAVWFGRLTPEKGAEFAVRAARAAGWRLTLAGPVYDRAYFDRRVAPLLGGDVRYAGQLDRAALGRLIGSAAVALLTPVWDEPFGLAYLEALACGTPVVGFAGGAAGEIITPQVGRLVPREDVLALTQVLREGVNSYDRGACRSYVATRFPVERMVRAYGGLYAEIAETGGGK